MSAFLDSISSTLGCNGQMLGLLTFGCYVAIMPKELIHLLFTVLGAAGYLIFLMLPNVQGRKKKTSKNLDDGVDQAKTNPPKTSSPVDSRHEDRRRRLFKRQIAEFLAETKSVASSDKRQASPGQMPTNVNTWYNWNMMGTTLSSTAVPYVQYGFPSNDQRETMPTMPQSAYMDVSGSMPPASTPAVCSEAQKRAMAAVAERLWVERNCPEFEDSMQCPSFQQMYADGNDPQSFPSMNEQPIYMQPMGVSGYGELDPAEATDMGPVALPCDPQNESKSTCWAWASTGMCKRGSNCRWQHPPPVW